ncbi:MAG: hypothetical protein Q4G70_05620 [Pseudomonadota bacterium]|nr:hypothetical protein [Pseudomonadota bacterium]
MHPIAPRWACHAPLLALADTSLRRYLPLPGTPVTARSGASNGRFY